MKYYDLFIAGPCVDVHRTRCILIVPHADDLFLYTHILLFLLFY